MLAIVPVSGERFPVRRLPLLPLVLLFSGLTTAHAREPSSAPRALPAADASETGPIVPREPVPRWVVEREASGGPPPADLDLGTSGRYELLRDIQTTSERGIYAQYTHRTTHVATTSAVDALARLHFVLAPSTRVRLHRAVIRRGDGGPKEIVVRSRRYAAEQAGAAIYDGRTALDFLFADVRVGDELDVAWTVETAESEVVANRYDLRTQAPLKDSYFTHYAAATGSASPGPTRSIFRQDPSDITPHGTVTKLAATDGIFRTELHNLPAIPFEGERPSDILVWPEVAETPFESWESVAKWSSERFRAGAAGAPTAPAVLAKLSELREKYATVDDRAEAAIRFVQDDIRYLGIEIGESGQRPHGPQQVLTQHFGDCKDKALLLTTLLRGLGVPAEVVLVESSGDLAPTDPPSPYRFNHAVVHLVEKNTIIDGTSSHEGGLYARASVPFRWALPVQDQADIAPSSPTLIAALPPVQDKPWIDRTDRYVVPPGNLSGAELTVTIIYRGEEADAMRAALATDGRSVVQKEHLEALARDEPGIETIKDKPLAFSDNRRKNEISIVEYYWIDDFERDGERAMSASLINDFARSPRTARRTLPLAIAPTDVRQTLILEVPAEAPELTGVDENGNYNDAYFHGTYVAQAAPRTFTATYTLSTIANGGVRGELAVPTRAVPAHLAERAKLMKVTNPAIGHVRPAGAEEPEGPRLLTAGKSWLGALPVVGTVLFVVASIFYREWAAGRRRRPPPGESPERPKPARTAAHAAAVFDAAPCCGPPFEGRFNRAIAFGTEEVHVEGGACPTCGTWKRIYFKIVG
jgi:hypothetical protein